MLVEELYHHGMDLDGLGMPDYNRLIQVLEQFHSHEKVVLELYSDNGSKVVFFQFTI